VTDGSITASKTANAKPLGSVSLPTPPTVPAAKAAGRLTPEAEAVASGDPIRVLIADDHAFFRRGLEAVLGEDAGIELVGQASDGAEAVELAGEALPDVVLMDIRMPKINGIEAARRPRS
jgi:PleD family two-component response regulator